MEIIQSCNSQIQFIPIGSFQPLQHTSYKKTETKNEPTGRSPGLVSFSIKSRETKSRVKRNQAIQTNVATFSKVFGLKFERVLAIFGWGSRAN